VEDDVHLPASQDEAAEDASEDEEETYAVQHGGATFLSLVFPEL
jgi:hypothetical protein